MTHIRIERLFKRFGEIVALDGVSLDLAPGSLTVLLGPSGCGKTTLLRLIAGFERPTSGRLLFDDVVMCDASLTIPPEKRNVGVVFQSYALWPHLSVAENVAYPLRARGVGRSDIGPRVAAALAMVDLADHHERAPDELSGGQRQRVALARCLVANARVIVFDEPLANLDMHLRAAMIESIADLHRRSTATIVYVTHDQAEALALADRIAVMRAGRVLQFAGPHDIYLRPATRSVAEFVGRGSLVTGTAVSLDANAARFSCAAGSFVARQALPSASGSTVDEPRLALLRPEALSLADNGLAAIVERRTYRGAAYEVEVTLQGDAGRLVLDCIEPPMVGASVRVAVADAWIVPGSAPRQDTCGQPSSEAIDAREQDDHDRE